MEVRKQQLFTYLKKAIIFYIVYHSYFYTVPKIVHVNRIIQRCFDNIEREVKIIQMLKILEYATVWFLRFHYFKVNFCSEFAVNLQ